MESEEQNAVIRSTMLGREDHGIMTFMIHLDLAKGGSQGFGGWVLGGEFGINVIKEILDAIEVDAWEKLKGRPCRIRGTHDKIDSIGNYLKDRWVSPAEIAAQMRKEGK